SYWVTDPLAAQYLKSNAKFETDQHSETVSSETFSLTGALGGLETPSEMSKNNALALHLSSGGKIVSEDDLKRLCIQIFAEKLKKIEINKVVQTMKGLKTGVKRYVEIKLHLHQDLNIAEQSEYLKLRLQHALNEKANIALPFEINIIVA